MGFDLSKIKQGDEVTIRLTVSAVNPNGIWAQRETWHPSEAINLTGDNAACIVEHHPKALSVGDRVRKLVLDLDEQGVQRTYKITAIDDDGWMLLADRGPDARVTTSRDFVERIP